jgi:predicted TIM-barrel fold metal-dependent hydrolase
MVERANPPDPQPKAPCLRLPAGACDTHFHLFGPESRYPFDPAATYTSGDATPEMLFDLQRVLGLSRGVVVSGGAYGRTYALAADACEHYPERLRGIILPPEDLAVAEIRRLDRLGIRGVRFISERQGRGLPTLNPALARRAFDAAGWQVQFYPRGDLEEMASRLLDLPNDVVLDHFGGFRAELGLNQPAFRKLLELLETGRVWVKLSGPMRCSQEDYPYAPMTPFAHALVRHAPERLVWGSDWPHVNMNDRRIPNDGDLVDLLAEWVPDEVVRKRILVDNAVRLFGFEEKS